MIPVRIEGSTHIIRADNTQTLHVVFTGTRIISRWAPTPAELALLVAGGSVELHVSGNIQPPIALAVSPLLLDE